MPIHPPDAAGTRNPFEPGFEPAPARAAATIILLRRGGKHADRELEVLLVKRNPGRPLHARGVGVPRRRGSRPTS